MKPETNRTARIIEDYLIGFGITAAVVVVIFALAVGIAITGTPQQAKAECCTPRLEVVKAENTTWICLIEEDSTGKEQHRSCQMSDMREHVEK